MQWLAIKEKGLKKTIKKLKKFKIIVDIKWAIS